MSSSITSPPPSLSLDLLDHHHQQQLQQQLPHSPEEQLCYVHCNICDTVLAVSVPSSSWFKTVTVRCGHCTHLLPVNMTMIMRPNNTTNNNNNNNFLPPSPPPQPQPPQQSFFSAAEIMMTSPNAGISTTTTTHPCPNLSMFNNHHQMADFPFHQPRTAGLFPPDHDLPRPLLVTRPPEKRQRVPSAYNRFIKDEIQRIKAENPDISHREAFSAAAKNWAHFPHIHFGLMPDQPLKKKPNTTLLHHPPQEAEGFFASANVGVAAAPY